jgi:hypothetical protein
MLGSIKPLTKTLFLDRLDPAHVVNAAVCPELPVCTVRDMIAEKVEGLAWGPDLKDGSAGAAGAQARADPDKREPRGFVWDDGLSLWFGQESGLTSRQGFRKTLDARTMAPS